MNKRLNTSYSNSMYNNEMRPLDYLYGPWESIQEMLTELHVEIDDIEPGLTIGVFAENGKVVEYWNPTKGVFVKKSMGGISDTFDTYEDALEKATSENIGSLVFVKESTEIDGATYPAGVYIIVEEGVIEPLQYGEFPEGEDMSEDEILAVNKDGIARLSDVYRRMKNIQFNTTKEILEKIKDNTDHILEDLDEYDPHDEEHFDDHMFIQRLEKTEGKITIAREPLDTDRILMNGDHLHETNPDTSDDTFITVKGTSVGNYKPGDVIKNGTSLDEVLRNLLVKALTPETPPVLPKIELTVNPTDNTHEVGSNVEITLGYNFIDGVVYTFKNETDLEESGVNAGCTCVDSTVKYYVKKPGSETFEPIDGNTFNITCEEESKYIFKVECDYNGDTCVVKDNIGNVLTDNSYHILNGHVSSPEEESVIHVKYKMWSIISTENYLDSIENNNTWFENFSNGETWFDGETCLYETITLKEDEKCYVICPTGYNVIFDTQIAKNIFASKENSEVVYTLSDGKFKKYVVWYMFNSGTYDNVRILADEVEGGGSETNPDVPDKPEPEPPVDDVPESGTVLWGDFFDSFGMSGSFDETNEKSSLQGYENAGFPNRVGFKENETSVTYSGTNVMVAMAPAGQNKPMELGHLWFNKSEDGRFETSDIKLYGATKLKFEHLQATNNSVCDSYYILNGGENLLGSFTKTTNDDGQASYDFEVPKGTETIKILLKHPKSNSANTRVDSLKLTVR